VGLGVSGAPDAQPVAAGEDRCPFLRRRAPGLDRPTRRPLDRLSPDNVRELARLCGGGSFGPLAEVYVLLLGIGGGRPGESAGVQDSELDAPDEGMGEVASRGPTAGASIPSSSTSTTIRRGAR